jgi:hypothetical protein
LKRFFNQLFFQRKVGGYRRYGWSEEGKDILQRKVTSISDNGIDLKRWGTIAS